MTTYYTFEEAMDRINKHLEENRTSRRRIRQKDLMKLFPENLYHLEDIDEAVCGGYGIYCLKIQNSYLIFPLDENEMIIGNGIAKMDESWLNALIETLEEYKKVEKRLKKSMETVNKIIESQKLRMIFKK